MLAAKKTRELLGLDQIIFVPAAIPPHKAVADGSPDGQIRYELTKLAISGEEGMSVSRIELDRTGPSYTVGDTLRELRECYGQDELYLLMGDGHVPVVSELAWAGRDRGYGGDRLHGAHKGGTMP